MTDDPTDPDAVIGALLDAALPDVPFEGWSDKVLRGAVAGTGTDPGLARALLPRGAVDLALAFSDRADAEMERRLAAEDMTHLRFREKIAAAVRTRLRVVEDDREAVRRAASLFALPHHAGKGSRAVWKTADRIWTALGDTSQDLDWYTKRATLSAVLSSTALYWLGDETPGHTATWAFLDRRIGNVMAFETAKGRVRATPLGRMMENGPMRLLDRIRRPDQSLRRGMPGWTRRRGRGDERGRREEDRDLD